MRTARLLTYPVVLGEGGSAHPPNPPPPPGSRQRDVAQDTNNE